MGKKIHKSNVQNEQQLIKRLRDYSLGLLRNVENRPTCVYLLHMNVNYVDLAIDAVKFKYVQ